MGEAAPLGYRHGAMSWFSTAVFVTMILFVFLGMIAMVAVLLLLIRNDELRQEEKLRANGVQAQGIIKSYLRRSMTQHRVLLEVRLPTGSIGRERLIAGLDDAWLAHHTALGIPVPVFVDPAGSGVAFAAPSGGPTALTTAETTTRVISLIGGAFLASAAVGTTFAVVSEVSSRSSDEEATPADVRRLRDAFDQAGLDVSRMRPRNSKESGVSVLVSFTLAEDTSCVIRVHTTATAAPGPELPPQPRCRYNGRLELCCGDGGGGDVPGLQAAFLAFKPR